MSMTLRSESFIFYFYLLNIYYILSILSTGFPDKSSGFSEKVSVFPEKGIRFFGKLFPDFRKNCPEKRISIFKYPKNRNHRDKKASGRRHPLLELNNLYFLVPLGLYNKQSFSCLLNFQILLYIVV